MPSQPDKEQKSKNCSIRKYIGLCTDTLPNVLNEIEQAKNRKIYGYKSKSRDDRLLIIINNNNKENRNSIFKSKRNKI